MAGEGDREGGRADQDRRQREQEEGHDAAQLQQLLGDGQRTEVDEHVHGEHLAAFLAGGVGVQQLSMTMYRVTSATPSSTRSSSHAQGLTTMACSRAMMQARAPQKAKVRI